MLTLVSRFLLNPRAWEFHDLHHKRLKSVSCYPSPFEWQYAWRSEPYVHVFQNKLTDGTCDVTVPSGI